MEIKDKPKSMSVREWITKKVATGIIIPENIIRRVINHQFDSAYEALDNCNSIEISGFGKFYYNEKKAIREIENCHSQKIAYEKIINDSTTTEKKRLSYIRRVKTVEDRLKGIIKKEEAYGKGKGNS